MPVCSCNMLLNADWHAFHYSGTLDCSVVELE